MYDSHPRRILLMYITKVSGHRAATVAIERSLKLLDPATEVMSINGFGYAYPTFEKVVNRAYMGIIRRTPKVWDYLYDNPQIVRRTEGLKNYLHKTSHKKLAKLFEQFRPDTVVCTQAFPCGMVADYKRAHGLNINLIGVLTDYAPHSFWLNEGVDYYVVPSEDSKERFLKKGIPAERIKVYGIPTHANFSIHKDRNIIARKLGFDAQIPVLLIMGGGQGLGPIKDVVKSLLKLKKELQLIVIAGVNKKLIKWLNKTALRSEKKMRVFEYVDNVDELMDVASLIITKPGGMTTSECLAKGLPMVIINPLPGQEMRNTDFLLEKGIALRVHKTDDIGEEVELLLKSPHNLQSMRQAALLNGRPHAAMDIARLILYAKPGAKALRGVGTSLHREFPQDQQIQLRDAPQDKPVDV